MSIRAQTPRQIAELVELRAEGAVFEPPPNSRAVFPGCQERYDALVIGVPAGTSKDTSVVQHPPALPVDHIALVSHHTLRRHDHHERCGGPASAKRSA